MEWLVVVLVAAGLTALGWWPSGPRFGKGQRLVDGADSMSHPYLKYGTGGGSGGMAG